LLCPYSVSFSLAICESPSGLCSDGFWLATSEASVVFRSASKASK
jgi:hypothetical protein